MTARWEGIETRERAGVWPGLAAGLLVSLLLHAGAGVWLVRSADAAAGQSPREDMPPAGMPPPPPEPLVLGQIDAERASITWLGVLENPAQAELPISEVDQAALSPAVGGEPTPESEPSEESAETAAEAREALPPVESESSPASAEPRAEGEPEPQLEPRAESEPAPGADDGPDAALVEPVETPIETPPGPALISAETPRQEPGVESAPEPASSDDAPAAPEPAAIMGPPAPDRAGAPPAQEPAPGGEPAPKPTPATPPGVPAIESPRESDAAMRERAIEYDSDLNRPIASKGLEIKTVRPVWPVLVRQSYRPRNPYLAIRFGADGKVKSVSFIAEQDGRKGTGIDVVDGPLVDAIYRWTAKGAQIDALDRSDPSATLTIPIRILLTDR